MEALLNISANKMDEGDIVLCSVTKIEGTSVFVNIDGNGEGSIIVSEIAPGRIRNLRDYVVPHKKIVCKILKIEGGHVHLSLRRVTHKEKQDTLKKNEAGKAIRVTLQRLLPENAERLIKTIQEHYDLADFFQNAKQDNSIVDKFFTPAEKERIQPLLKEKTKEIEVKREFHLKCPQSDGIIMLKKILNFEEPGVELLYLAGSRYVIKLKSMKYKEANILLNQHLEEIEERSRKSHCEFEIRGK